MKYVCPICGYVYDEANQGVPWEALPEDYACPICGAPKSVFKAQAAPAQPQAAPSASAEDAAPHAGGEISLSAAQLSAICSNLARGCEKQYMPAEQALFAELAERYAKAVPPGEGGLEELTAVIKRAADRDFAQATAAAQSEGDRGAQRAIVWGERVNFVLQSLFERYGREGEAMLKDADIWVCSICGFIYIGQTPPEICPVCKVPSFRFERGGELQ